MKTRIDTNQKHVWAQIDNLCVSVLGEIYSG